MKTSKTWFFLLTASLWIAVSSQVKADVDVSVGVQINAVADFHGPLTSHGTWVTVGSYGSCWRPAHVAVGWRPYCDGHWEWTDCGWYWVSDEPWAWACYHYGSWYYDSVGWYWVPGVEWAPAWVSWRVGGGHIGWAPRPPIGVVVAPTRYVFVGDRHFRERVRPTTVIVNNTTIINNTKEINVVKRETRNIGGRNEQIIVNEGPGVDVVQKATNQKITPLPVQQADLQTPVPKEVKRKQVDRTAPAQPLSQQNQNQPQPQNQQQAVQQPQQQQVTPERQAQAAAEKKDQADKKAPAPAPSALPPVAPPAEKNPAQPAPDRERPNREKNDRSQEKVAPEANAPVPRPEQTEKAVPIEKNAPPQKVAPPAPAPQTVAPQPKRTEWEQAPQPKKERPPEPVAPQPRQSEPPPQVSPAPVTPPPSERNVSPGNPSQPPANVAPQPQPSPQQPQHHPQGQQRGNERGKEHKSR